MADGPCLIHPAAAAGLPANFSTLKCLAVHPLSQPDFSSIRQQHLNAQVTWYCQEDVYP